MNDFQKYWDTRIDANERFFNNYPHIANFAFSECQALWGHMDEERKALLARHNALVEAVAWERECDVLFQDARANYIDITESLIAARSEVDRLIADCKGEG